MESQRSFILEGFGALQAFGEFSTMLVSIMLLQLSSIHCCIGAILKLAFDPLLSFMSSSSVLLHCFLTSVLLGAAWPVTGVISSLMYHFLMVPQSACFPGPEVASSVVTPVNNIPPCSASLLPNLSWLFFFWLFLGTDDHWLLLTSPWNCRWAVR